MDKNNAWVVVLIVLIGVALISYGVYGLYKVSKYEKTTAVFDNSQLVTSRNSNGSRSTSFTWVYHFYVDGKLYHVDVNSMQLDEPKEKEITVKYDPKDPTKNIAGKDYENYMLIIVGILFAWPVFMVKQPDDELADEETVRKSVRMAGFYVTFFAGALFLLLFMSDDFNLLAMFTVNLFPVIIITFFFVVGVLLIARAYNPNYVIDYKIKNGKKVAVFRDAREGNTVSSNENSNLEK